MRRRLLNLGHERNVAKRKQVPFVHVYVDSIAELEVVASRRAAAALFGVILRARHVHVRDANVSGAAATAE
jgi:hypothetical protein